MMVQILADLFDLGERLKHYPLSIFNCPFAQLYHTLPPRFKRLDLMAKMVYNNIRQRTGGDDGMNSHGYKPLSELTLMDDYMFGVVMQDPEIAKMMIERILNTRIRSVGYVEPQKSLKEQYGARGVRLDLYVEDENGTIYNVEIQTTDKRNLPRRMRYYQSIIDLHVLKPGANYNALRRSYVIFICNYDPFGLNRCVYTFENRCLEDIALPLDDGTSKVVVNTVGDERDIDAPLREILQYFRDGGVTGPASRLLEDAVNNVRNSEERSREYMVLMAHDMEIREEGIELGLKQGLENGERQMGILFTKLTALNRLDDYARAIADPEYRRTLYDEFQIK